MAWVELVPIGLILLLVAWIFLRPYPGDPKSSTESSSQDSSEQSKTDPAKDAGSAAQKNAELDEDKE